MPTEGLVPSGRQTASPNNTMFWLAFMAAWLAFVAAIAAVAMLLGRGSLKENVRAGLIEALLDPNPRPWTQRVNQAFLGIFDLIYGGEKTDLEQVEKTDLEQVLWLALLLTPLMLFVDVVALAIFYLASGKGGQIVKDFQNCNEAALFFVILVALVLPGSRLVIDRLWLLQTQRVLATAIFGILLIPVVTVLGLWLGTGPCTEKDILTLIREDWELIPAFGGPAGVLAIVVVAFQPSLKRIPIRPIRALVSSAVFMALIGGVFRRDDVGAFLDALFVQGPTLLGMIALNIFADTVSLAETRHLLKLGKYANVPKLAGLLVIDLLLSAVIFLILPTVVLESLDPTFWEGLVFQGQERPWLGILFFTTFSTSIIFYLFIPTALLLRPLSLIVKNVGAPFRDEWIRNTPERALAVILIVLVTLVFGFAAIILGLR